MVARLEPASFLHDGPFLPRDEVPDDVRARLEELWATKPWRAELDQMRAHLSRALKNAVTEDHAQVYREFAARLRGGGGRFGVPASLLPVFWAWVTAPGKERHPLDLVPALFSRHAVVALEGVEDPHQGPRAARDAGWDGKPALTALLRVDLEKIEGAELERLLENLRRLAAARKHARAPRPHDAARTQCIADYVMRCLRIDDRPEAVPPELWRDARAAWEVFARDGAIEKPVVALIRAMYRADYRTPVASKVVKDVLAADRERLTALWIEEA